MTSVEVKKLVNLVKLHSTLRGFLKTRVMVHKASSTTPLQIQKDLRGMKNMTEQSAVHNQLAARIIKKKKYKKK